MRPFEKINAYEQAGLILKAMSEQPGRSEEERQRLREESEGKLYRAVWLCSRLCHRLPGLQDVIRDVWLAFDTLMAAVDHSDRATHDKLREKARLFQLIRDHCQSLDLLHQITSLAPEEHLKMMVENFVGQSQYEQALTFIDMLKCTAQGAAGNAAVFPNVLNVYVKAAEAALLSSGSGNPQGTDASEFFRAAFADVFHSTCDSSVTASSGSE
jgi:hypothetical protein